MPSLDDAIARYAAIESTFAADAEALVEGAAPSRPKRRRVR
jgi:hypothetical protein